MSKNLIYIGSGIGREGTALFVHTQNVAKLYKKLGYNVVFVCEGNDKQEKKVTHEGFDYYYTKQYLNVPKVRYFEYIIETLYGLKLWNLFKKAAKEHVPDAVVLYGYNPEKRLIDFCKKKDIPLIVERVDWFEKSDRNSFFARNMLQRKVDYTFSKLDFKANGIIAISPYLYNYYSEKNAKTIEIPPIFDLTNCDELVTKNSNGKLNLVYAGSLGGNKDIILPAIKAVKQINEKENKIRFDIVGVSENEIYKSFEKCNLEEIGIFAHGRCSHNDTLSIIKNADFSFLLRHNKRYAKAGFSTKFAESMILGVPVICTKVGGADSLITNMKNGVLVNDNEVKTIEQVLESLCELSDERVTEIKQNAFDCGHELFSIDTYKEPLKKFMDELK